MKIFILGEITMPKLMSLAILFVSFVLVACGQKGPLVLPSETSKVSTVETTGDAENRSDETSATEQNQDAADQQVTEESTTPSIGE